jgi:ferredoxin-thioredoxin reductase catalytic subunit
MIEVLKAHQRSIGHRDMREHCICGLAGPVREANWIVRHQAEAIEAAGYRKHEQSDQLQNDTCPCGHTWDEHNFDVGCLAGWEYEGPDPGIASKDGCYCQLAHTEKSI